MQFILLMALNTFMLYSITAVPISAIIWVKGRQKVNWSIWEYIFVFIPWIYWFFLMIIVDTGTKTFANLKEAYICGIFGGLILLTRLVVPASSEKKLVILLKGLMISILLVTLIFFFTPALPE